MPVRKIVWQKLKPCLYNQTFFEVIKHIIRLTTLVWIYNYYSSYKIVSLHINIFGY